MDLPNDREVMEMLDDLKEAIGFELIRVPRRGKAALYLVTVNIGNYKPATNPVAALLGAIIDMVNEIVELRRKVLDFEEAEYNRQMDAWDE